MEFPIVDTHVHLWDPANLRYSWLQGNPTLNRRFLLKEFNDASAGLNVGGIVFVECDAHPSQGLAEAKWVVSLAEQDPRIQGIVAFAPLEKGTEVQSDLDHLAAMPLVKGVRRLIQGESVDFCVQPGFVAGVQLLAEYDLSFDICVRRDQLLSAIELVSKCPGVRFMLDHIAKPDIARNQFEPWATELHQLAQFPNVCCKMSGLVTEADRDAWSVDDLRPYIQHVLQCFGWDRVVYGGDWPVATLAASYHQWITALAHATAHNSVQQRRKLFHDNAKQFYRLQKRADCNQPITEIG